MNNEARGLLDIHALTTVISRRLWPILATIAIVLVLTAGAYFLIKPQYMATARVALDRQSADLMKVGVQGDGVTVDSPAVDTEVQVLRSPAVAEAVVKRLQLEKVAGIGQPVNGPPVPLDAARRRAVDTIRNTLDIKRDGTSYAIAVNYTLNDPLLATNIVNATVNSYISGQRDGKIGDRNEELLQLRDRMGKLRSEVIAAETAVAQYRAATNLVDITKDSTSAQQELSVLNTELASAQADQAAAQARAAASTSGTTSSMLQNPVVNQLLTRQAQLRQERNDLLGRYGEKHPALASVDRQLLEVTNSIAAETKRVRSSVTADANIAGQRAASIRASIGRAKGELLAGNNASVRLAELERNAESARQLYQAFLDRYRGALATQGTERSNSYVIAPALVPRVPVSPSLPAFVLGGIMAALIAAALVAFTLELMERGFRSRSELESGLGLPAMGSIPDLKTVKDVDLKSFAPLHMADYLVANQDSIFTESFRSLRTALRIGKDGGVSRSIAITSSIADEGKTTMAICLARSAALAGYKVVLVDCDLRRRASSRSLTDKLATGLIDVLKGTTPIEKALIQDSASGAFLLPQREAEGTDYDIIASREMNDLIQKLKLTFDLVLLDTAPVLPVAESRAVCAMADATLLVVRWRSTPTAAAQMALRDLQRGEANVVGTALAKVNVGTRAGIGNEIYYYTAYTPA